VKEYADIIKFKLDGKDYPDSQGARVGPNQRLKTAFGIDNAFTNPDKTAKNVFSANTMKLMRDAIKLDTENTTGDWSDIRMYTMNCCKEYLQRASNSGRLHLPELVQFVTLKVSLYYLFPGEASNINDISGIWSTSVIESTKSGLLRKELKQGNQDGQVRRNFTMRCEE
jgi:hypothetical protein